MVHYGGRDFHKALKKKCNCHKYTSNSTMTFTVVNLQPEDTAVYFCVCGPSVLPDINKPTQICSTHETKPPTINKKNTG